MLDSMVDGVNSYGDLLTSDVRVMRGGRKVANWCKNIQTGFKNGATCRKLSSRQKCKILKIGKTTVSLYSQKMKDIDKIERKKKKQQPRWFLLCQTDLSWLGLPSLKKRLRQDVKHVQISDGNWQELIEKICSYGMEEQ